MGNVPDESGVVPDETGELSTPKETVPDVDSGVETEGAPAATDETDVAIKREMKQLREAEKAANAEADDLRRRNAELESREHQPAETSTETTGEPNYDDYESPADFHSDMAKWALKNEREKIREEDAQQTASEARKEAEQNYSDGIVAAREKHPDFTDVVNRGSRYTSDETIDDIVKCDNAHDIAYYLGENPMEARRISALTPLKRARELGKLEARFAGDGAGATPSGGPSQNTITGANEPAAELPTGGSDRDSGGETSAEFAVRRIAERKANREGNSVEPREGSREARRSRAVKT